MAELVSINIRKAENGCTISVESKYKNKEGYENYETKNYVSDDLLVEEVLKYIKADVEEETKEEPKLNFSPKKFR